MQRNPRIGVVSMGCPKALVDSERIMTQLRAEGYDIVGSYSDADLVIVNTCGFLNEAVAESVDAINEAMHENGRVIVTGCLGAKKHLDGTPYLDDVCPDVLGVTGPGEFDKVYELVHKHLPQPHSPYWDLVPKAGLKLTPSHYAYLKISEGCNHRCAFCIIPQLRGKLVSRPIGEVLREAELLREAGVKELMVISQDTSAYGADCRYRIDFNDQGKALQTKLYDLARELGDMGMWIRLHYVYPYPAVDQVVELMADGKILPYLDIPFQHAHPRVLKSMKRPAATEKTLERIQAWRRICPDLTIRSTFIAGFPGETEEEFQELCDFVDETEFDDVGVFTYSQEEGTAAARMDGQIPEDVKEERYHALMAIQAKVSERRNQELEGTIHTFLVESIQEEGGVRQAVGRIEVQAPEVDGLTYLEDAEAVQPGDMVQVRIVQGFAYDLVAELV